MSEQNKPQGSAKPGDNGASGEDQPKFLTAEEAGTLVSTIVNKAIGSRLKDFESRQTTALSEAIEAAFAKRDAATPAGTSGRDEDGGSKGSKGKGNGTAPDPALAELQQRQQKLEDDLKREKEEKRKLIQTQRDKDAISRTTDALTKSGVPAVVAPRVARALYNDKQVRYRQGSEDELEFVLDPDEGGLDLAAGVSKWAKTDEGKVYMPPAPSGTGARTGAPVPVGGNRTVPLDNESVNRALEEQFNGRI